MKRKAQTLIVGLERSLTDDLAADELGASVRVVDILLVAIFVSVGLAAVDTALAGGAGLRNTAVSAAWWAWGALLGGGGRQGGAGDEGEAENGELHVDRFGWVGLE